MYELVHPIDPTDGRNKGKTGKGNTIYEPFYIDSRYTRIPIRWLPPDCTLLPVLPSYRARYPSLRLRASRTPPLSRLCSIPDRGKCRILKGTRNSRDERRLLTEQSHSEPRSQELQQQAS